MTYTHMMEAQKNVQSSIVGGINSNMSSILAAFLYGSCSVLIAFINKLLMTSFEFDFPVFIMASQMLFTILILEVLAFFNVVTLPRYTLERGKMFALPALFYGINSVLALSALSHMNIALYGVLKRCVPMVTMFLSVLILKKGWPSKLTMMSVVMLTLGCIIAGFGDLGFNLLGYTCGALSNVAQSIYLLLVQRATNGKLSIVESLQLNSINTLPFLALFCVVNGEFKEIRSWDDFSDPSLIIVFFLAISIGCLLNYSLFLCTSLTSALTTSVVGGLKALAQTILGILTFGGVSHNLPTFVGITMSVSGGLSYIFAKYRENLKKHSVDLRKIMSFSTAEDLKSIKSENGISNGDVRNVSVTTSNHQHTK